MAFYVIFESCYLGVSTLCTILSMRFVVEGVLSTHLLQLVRGGMMQQSKVYLTQTSHIALHNNGSSSNHPFSPGVRGLLNPRNLVFQLPTLQLSEPPTDAAYHKPSPGFHADSFVPPHHECSSNVWPGLSVRECRAQHNRAADVSWVNKTKLRDATGNQQEDISILIMNLYTCIYI